MKCRAPRPPRPKKKYTGWQEKQNVIQKNSLTLNYVSRLIFVYLREKAGFGRKRFERYNNGSQDTGRWYIERYSTEADTDQDYAVTSYYALRSHLRYFNWDPETELWADDVFDTLVSTDGIVRSKREIIAKNVEYARGISFYAREMLCMAAKELHDTNGFGRERLNAVLHPVRDRYLELMRLYISESSVAYWDELQKAVDEFNAIGFFQKEELGRAFLI